MTTECDINIDEKIKNTVREPSMYNVIMLNDESTPMDFVIDVLENIFKHSRESSENLTLTIHNDGSAVVGTYTYELAEQKATETVNLSRANGFPLQIKIDEEG